MKISISAASRLTGKHRSTVSKIASDLQAFPGPKGAWLYESRELLQHLYVGSDGAPTASEALRLLSLARCDQVKLQTAQAREKWWPYAEVKGLILELCAIVRQTLIGNENKVLSFELINDILRQLRDAFANSESRNS